MTAGEIPIEHALALRVIECVCYCVNHHKDDRKERESERETKKKEFLLFRGSLYFADGSMSFFSHRHPKDDDEELLCVCAISIYETVGFSS